MKDVNDPIPLSYARPPDHPPQPSAQRPKIRLSFVLFCTLPLLVLLLITYGLVTETPKPAPRPQPIPASPEEQRRLNDFHQSGEMFNGQY